MFIIFKNPIFNRLSLNKTIYKILATQNSLRDLENFCEKKKINFPKNIIEISNTQKIESLINKDSIHQGIIAKIDPILIRNEQEFFNPDSKEDSLPQKILILDKISDPQNIGAIIRSCLAFNVTNIS